MRFRFMALVTLLCLSLSWAHADESKPHLHPIKGPSQIKLGNNLASLDLPASMLYLNVEDTKAFLKVNGNPPSGREVGLVGPAEGKGNWFVIIEYNETGYVSDDDAGKIDADAILKSIREGTEAANEERKSNGESTMNVDGWAALPVYKKATHHVVWAVKGSSSNKSEGDVVNYNTRILGRHGVLEMNLVCDPADLEQNKKDVAVLLDKTHYMAGQRYEDYQASTDKKADFGLTGLILGGGAAAAAVKLGLFGKLGKLLVVVLLALKKFVILIFAAMAGFFRKLTGGKKTNTDAPVATIIKE